MTADLLATSHCYAPSFRVFARRLQYFFVVAMLTVVPIIRAIELRIGSAYPLTITDVDQHPLSTTDGHVSVILVVTRKDEQKAQMVGDRTPRACLGDPKYRLITVVNFQQKILSPFRGVIMALIRYRLEAEAKELQKIYSARHLSRSARSDIFVAADFDGKTVSQFGIAPTSGEFAVFVFDGRGRLVKRWNDVPSAEALAAAMNEAR